VSSYILICVKMVDVRGGSLTVCLAKPSAPWKNTLMDQQGVVPTG
jgi:hypothetical protein